MFSKKVLWRLVFSFVYVIALSSTINAIAAERLPYLPYSEFIQRVKSGNIRTLEVNDGRGYRIMGTYVEPDGTLHSFRTSRPRQLVDDPLLSTLLNKRGITVNVVPSKPRAQRPTSITLFMLYFGRYGYGFAILLALFTLYLVARVNIKVTHIEQHLFFSRPDSSGESAPLPEAPQADA
ncbi:MAG: hypothetical protein GXO98_00515 [Nitrospirae bacterium]|nr:hypothetical protein [Nitrospirota bacterium]